MLFAVALCLLYGILLIGLQRFSGVPYNALPDSASNLLRGGLVPVAIIA